MEVIHIARICIDCIEHCMIVELHTINYIQHDKCLLNCIIIWGTLPS